MINTRRLARILHYVSQLYEKVLETDQAPFLIGTIFQLGGLLKIEVRNYLKTKSKYDSKFHLVCPLIEENKASEDMMKRSERYLSTAEIAFFESKDGLMSYIARFIQALVTNRNHEASGINAQNFDKYFDFTFDESKVDEGVNEKEGAAKSGGPQKFESTHYILNWLFDLLQFCFQYLVRTKTHSIGEEMSFESLNLSYYVENFNELISLICNSISTVCPQADYLMCLWQIKHAWDPEQAEKIFL